METIGYVMVAIAIVGTVLNAYKKISGFYLWIVTDIYFVAYNFVHEIYFQAILFSVYILIACLGIYNWRKNNEK